MGMNLRFSPLEWHDGTNIFALTKAVTVSGTITFSSALTFSGALAVAKTGSIALATLSSTAGSGVALTSSLTKALGIYADDAGAALGASAVRAAQFRTLVTVSHSNEVSIFGSQSQLKIANPASATLTTGNRAGAWNYLELEPTASTTLTLSGAGKVTAASFNMVSMSNAAATVVISANHILAGVAALTNLTTTGPTYTETGKIAAFAAVNNASASYNPFTYGLYLPPDAVSKGILIGNSTSDPIVTTSTGTVNMVDVNMKASGASGTFRGIISYAEFSGTNVGVTTNLYAIRGYAKVSGTAAGSNTFYTAGVQGKLELAGTITGGKHAALLGQLNASAGVAAATGGIMYCVWADGMQLAAAPAAGLTVVGLGIEMPDGTNTFNAAAYVYGKATYLLDLQGPTTDYLATVGTAPAAATGSIKINTPSGVRYILITDDPTA